MTTLHDIEQQAAAFAEARRQLTELVTKLNDKIEALLRNHMDALNAAVAGAAAEYDKLKTLIEAAPGLFTKPRTVVMHGVKLGYQKGKGGIEIADPDRTCELIHKHLHDIEDQLIQTTYKPIKSAIEQLLSPADLALYGGARSLVDWHARHRFCARCGAPTRLAKGGWQR